MNHLLFNPDCRQFSRVSFKLNRTITQPWKLFNALFPFFSTLHNSSIHAPFCSSPLSLSLIVFCVMEWLLRTWLLCWTLVDEVCLCLSALTCRNRDTAYSKINTQSRREKGWARDIEKRKEEGGGLKVHKCNKAEEQEQGWSRMWLENKKEGNLNTWLSCC